MAKLSSAELEDYTKALQESNSVTTEELRELKKQRRLVRQPPYITTFNHHQNIAFRLIDTDMSYQTKNREYAHFSRAKKKEYVGDLESRVKELTDQTNQLNTKVAALSAENKGLKAKVQIPHGKFRVVRLTHFIAGDTPSEDGEAIHGSIHFAHEHDQHQASTNPQTRTVSQLQGCCGCLRSDIPVFVWAVLQCH